MKEMELGNRLIEAVAEYLDTVMREAVKEKRINKSEYVKYLYDICDYYEKSMYDMAGSLTVRIIGKAGCSYDEELIYQIAENRDAADVFFSYIEDYILDRYVLEEIMGKWEVIIYERM